MNFFKFNKILLILFCLQIFNVGTSFSSNNYFAVRNLDPVLVNGKKYLFFPINVVGHQYLNSQDFEKGSVVINGIQYDSLMLNLDIYNQQLVLRFTNLQGATQVLSMSNAWVTKFSIGRDNFEFKSMEDGTKRIFQVIGSGNIKILYSWSKTMKLNPSSGKYDFSRPQKKSFLLIDSELKAFKRNRSFLKCFDDDQKKLLKNYLRDNRLKISRLNKYQIEDLIFYCNKIYKN